MEHSITINYPESLAFTLKMKSREFKREMKQLSLVKLYELGKLSSEQAANLLNITRIEFLDLLEKYNVSYFHKGLEDELDSDLKNA